MSKKTADLVKAWREFKRADERLFDAVMALQDESHNRELSPHQRKRLREFADDSAFLKLMLSVQCARHAVDG